MAFFLPTDFDKERLMNINFRRNPLGILLILALCATSFAALRARSGERPKAPATAIAVIDWLNMTDKLDAWTTVRVELKDKEEAYKKASDEKRAQITAKGDELKILPKEGPAFDQANQEIQSQIAQFKTWSKLEEERLVKMELREQLTLYQKINDAVKAIAERDGWDIVLWNDSGSKDIDFAHLEESAQLISTRHIFYAADAVDITETVIQYMNNNDAAVSAEDGN